MASQLIARAGNEALTVNPTIADIDITTAGSSFLWAIFSAMAFSGLATYVWAVLAVDRGQRTFHYLSMIILFTASVAYYSMASDLGAAAIRVEYLNGWDLSRSGGMYPTRSVWYARYIDWVVTTPALLLEILLVTGLPLSTISITIFMDLVMIITGLIGSLVSSTYKWGYFTFGCVAMFYVFWVLLVDGRKSAEALGPEFKKSYLVSTLILVTLWFLYPVAWGLADGSNTISPDGEMVFYGVLDLLAKPVFAFVHMWSLRDCDLNKLQLSSGKYTETATPAAVESGEKVERR